MNPQGLALHETLELHELLQFRNLCCTKATTMQALVSDEQLKTIMRTDVETTREHIQELQGLLSNSNFQ
ncbi:hypothetical protein [Ammoniphilus sp. CFH 90114]|uniref:hypothetical protein n=1 Tax=Ammoniphilus sp. CFH 90114 TaxID=2493665 RepID=UPI00100E0EF9|nr:hypothetical protein [Ammoniphilus sp. CFH 90114]RXT13677.1 hypothetical protein EIZ39_05880 [Ammoniphilus sp. CFH 90114]